MEKKRVDYRRRTTASINITPMIDILLVLLVIFMTVTPMTSTGFDTSVARSADPPPKQPDPALIVSLDRDGAIRINDIPVDGTVGAFKSQLQEILKTRVDRTIFVNADSGLPFQAVARIIDESHTAGAVRIGLMTEKSH